MRVMLYKGMTARYKIIAYSPYAEMVIKGDM